MTKRDKIKYKKLSKELKALAAKYTKLQAEADHEYNNISSPPEHDDWLYAEQLASVCHEMEDVQEKYEEVDDKMRLLFNKE